MFNYNSRNIMFAFIAYFHTSGVFSRCQRIAFNRYKFRFVNSFIFPFLPFLISSFDINFVVIFPNFILSFNVFRLRKEYCQLYNGFRGEIYIAPVLPSFCFVKFSDLPIHGIAGNTQTFFQFFHRYPALWRFFRLFQYFERFMGKPTLSVLRMLDPICNITFFEPFCQVRFVDSQQLRQFVKRNGIISCINLRIHHSNRQKS